MTEDSAPSERETHILGDEPPAGVSEELRVLHAPPGTRGPPVNGCGRREAAWSLPDTPPRGHSSRDAVLRFGHASSPPQDEELRSLEESIEQLNLLILDLDPTFTPPCCHSPASPGGHAHSTGRQQDSHPTSTPVFNAPGWTHSTTQTWSSSVNGGSPLPSQLGGLRTTDSVDYGGRGSVIDSCGVTPSTPAFPVSPPTPYGILLSDTTERQPERSRSTQDSLNFLDSMKLTGSTDADMCMTPDPCQGMLCSRTSGSSGSPLPHTHSSTPPPAWTDRTPPASFRSPFQPRTHSSPRGARPGVLPGGPETSRSSLTLGDGSLLEQSLLEAMGGLESLGFGLDPPGPDPPLLPQKRRGSGGVGELLSPSPLPLCASSSPLSITASSPETPRGFSRTSSPGYSDLSASKQDTVKFVQDTSRFWYKPDISRDQAIRVLKDKEPGSFVVRDSHSFRGAYGLALKVSTPPPSALQQSKTGDPSSELVRHFLIECARKGVRLKGCPDEPYFGSLTALVCQHSITPLALPCRLILPDRDPMEEISDSSPQTATNSAAELLKQGAACNVWYLGSVELESLTGQQAVQKAASQTLAAEPPPTSTLVHFKVSAQGITLTDNQRKLFFRRHYNVNTVIFCSLDPQGRRWERGGGATAKLFGFVARKAQSGTENVCHLFAEHDPEQPASAIVTFVSKVMIGSQKK